MMAETFEVSTSDTPGHRDYRAFMRTETPNLILPTVQDQFLTWLRGKGIDLDNACDANATVDGSTASIARHTQGHDEYLRCRLIESDTPLGTWCTQVVASSAGWIDLTVTNSEGRFVAVPKIARYLMQTLDLRDASLQLVDEVKQWDINEVDTLIDLLEDQDRHGLVFVAGTGEEDGLYGAFRQRVATWTREVFGLAQCIILTPRATQALNVRLGYHGVPPWTLRTYYPGVAPSHVVDSRRHKYLTTATLANEEDWRLRKRLANVARSHAVTRLDPTEVLRAKRAFVRVETRALLAAFDKTDSVVDATSAGEILSPPHTIATPTRTATDSLEVAEVETGRSERQVIASLEFELDLVRSVLGITSITRDALESVTRTRDSPFSADGSLGNALKTASLRIKEQLTRIEELEDFQREAVRALDDQQLERADLQDELETTRAEARWLRDRFKAISDYETASAQVPVELRESYPSSCAELIQRLRTELGVLVFTGNEDMARVVDNADTMELAVRSAWEACIALREYVRAREDGNWDGNVDQYLRNRPQGYEGVSPGKHSPTETKVTMSQFGSERWFPVPRNVDPAGAIAMKAHFRLASIGMLSPRMHYYDDYLNTGKVYIGYIGRHLTNTMTN